MSGQQRRIAHVRVMSASPPAAVNWMSLGDGRNGPVHDIAKSLNVRPKHSSNADYNVLADSVLQAEIWPELKPFINQRLRCSDVPCVKASGTT